MTVSGTPIASGSNIVTCVGTLTTGHFTSLVATAITCATGYGAKADFSACLSCASTLTGISTCLPTAANTATKFVCLSGYYAASDVKNNIINILFRNNIILIYNLDLMLFL